MKVEFSLTPRQIELAFPKHSYEGNLQPIRASIWGNQEPLVPISIHALNTIPSQRIIRLSHARRQHYRDMARAPLYQYNIGTPVIRVPDSALCAECTPRLSQLAQPKNLNPAFKPYKTQEEMYSHGKRREMIKVNPRIEHLSRPKERMARIKYLSPVVDTSPQLFRTEDTRLSSELTTLVDRLSIPKVKQEFLPKDLEVSRAALMYKPSERILRMSKPREVPYTVQKSKHVSEQAKNYVATERMKLLAEPVVRPRGEYYLTEKQVVRTVTTKARCSQRLSELSEPKMLVPRYPPRGLHEIGKVSQRALKASCSDRLSDLSQPRVFRV